MTKPDHLPSDDLVLLDQAIETLKVYCGVILLSFAKHGRGLRDTISRNFVARGMACMENIFLVWREGSEQDAWILHRSLLDRLFHLHYLAKEDGFATFEEFSFLSQYEARHKLLCDADMREKVPASLKQLQQSNKARYDQLTTGKARWSHPRAEDVAKSMGLGFLYRFGYDYSSTHVHPMAHDGAADFERLTSPAQKRSVPDATVIRNSILVQSLLIQEALNVSTMHWRAIVYDFLEQVRSFLGDGNLEFHATFYRIGKAWPGFDLCEPHEDVGRA